MNTRDHIGEADESGSTTRLEPTPRIAARTPGGSRAGVRGAKEKTASPLFSRALAPYAASVSVALLLAVCLVSLERIKYPLAAFLDGGGEFTALPLFLIQNLGILDYALMALAAASAAFVLALEIRVRALSEALRNPTALAQSVLLLVLLTWFAQAFLYPGVLLGGDTQFHVARIAHVSRALTEGDMLHWSNWWNAGTPVLSFTGPLLFWIGGVVDTIFNEPHVTTKVVLFLSHVLSGVLQYALLRKWGVGPFGALIGALGYAGAWTHLHVLVYKGTLPQALTYALLPALFLAFEASTKRGRALSFHWLALALLSAAALINHPTNGMFAGIYVGLFAVATVLVQHHSIRSVAASATAGVGGILMTLFLVVPTIAEREWVTMTADHSFFSLRWPDAEYWSHVLVWSNANTGTGANFDAYVGLSLVLLALVGLGALFAGRVDSRETRVFGVILGMLLAVSLVLTGPHIRESIFTLFFLSGLAGLGAHRLAQSRQLRGHLPAIVLMLVFLDLGPTAIQPLARTDKAYFDAGAEQLAEPNHHRTVFSNTFDGDFRLPIWTSPLLHYPLQQIAVPYAYSVTHFHNYGAAALKRAERNLVDQGALQPDTKKLLRLLNVSRIVNDTAEGFDMPSEIIDVRAGNALGRLVPVSTATPWVAANSLEVLAPPPELDEPVVWDSHFDASGTAQTRSLDAFLDQVLERMQLLADAPSANAVAVRSLPEGWPRAEPYTGPLPTTSLVSYAVDSDTIEARIEADRPGYVRLSHVWYPFLRVEHNGAAIDPVRSTMNMIVLPLDAGVNDYRIEPVYSELRRGMDLISLGIALALVAATLIAEAHRRTTKDDRYLEQHQPQRR